MWGRKQFSGKIMNTAGCQMQSRK